MVEYSQLRVSFKMLGTEGGAKLTKLLTVSISGSALSKFGSQHLQTDSPHPSWPRHSAPGCSCWRGWLDISLHWGGG